MWYNKDMETTLTQEDYKNIAVLIQKATITGQEATTVAILLQKIGKLLEPAPKEEDKPKK